MVGVRTALWLPLGRGQARRASSLDPRVHRVGREAGLGRARSPSSRARAARTVASASRSRSAQATSGTPRRRTRWRCAHAGRPGRGGTSGSRRTWTQYCGVRRRQAVVDDLQPGPRLAGRLRPAVDERDELRAWTTPRRRQYRAEQACAGRRRVKPCSRMSASIAASASRRGSEQARSMAVRSGVVTRTPSHLHPVLGIRSRVPPAHLGPLGRVVAAQHVGLHRRDASRARRTAGRSTPRIHAAVRSHSTDVRADHQAPRPATWSSGQRDVAAQVDPGGARCTTRRVLAAVRQLGPRRNPDVLAVCVGERAVRKRSSTFPEAVRAPGPTYHRRRPALWTSRLRTPAMWRPRRPSASKPRCPYSAGPDPQLNLGGRRAGPGRRARRRARGPRRRRRRRARRPRGGGPGGSGSRVRRASRTWSSRWWRWAT